jgi:hypothetical protein
MPEKPKTPAQQKRLEKSSLFGTQQASGLLDGITLGCVLLFGMRLVAAVLFVHFVATATFGSLVR